MILCSECGKENNDNDKFCSECGVTLNTFKQTVAKKEKQIKKFKLTSIVMIALFSLCLVVAFKF